MNRRTFFAALAAAVAAPATPHRVYSFLWDNPLVKAPSDFEGRIYSYAQLFVSMPFYGINRAQAGILDDLKQGAEKLYAERVRLRELTIVSPTLYRYLKQFPELFS